MIYSNMLELLRDSIRSLAPADEIKVKVPLCLEPHESALIRQTLWETSVKCTPARVFDVTDPLNPVVKHPPSE